LRSSLTFLLLFTCSCAPTAPDPAEAPSPSTAAPEAQIEGGSTLPARTIALTYDDGPDEHTLELATWLHDRGIPATFFVNGCNFAGHEQTPCRNKGRHDFPADILGQLVALGHRVANHTEQHFDLTEDKLSEADRLDQFRRTQALIDPYVTDGVYLFRPPHNHWNKGLSDLLAHTTDLARLSGPIKYDDGGGDWGCTDPSIFNPPLTPEQCADEYLKVQSPQRNGIFQMHDRNPNAPGTRYALELTQALLAKLDAMPGVPLRFVPLDAIPEVHGSDRFSRPAVWSQELSDTALPDEVPLRLGDLDGDHRADTCVRKHDGVWCALTGAHAQTGHLALWSGDLSDDRGFASESRGGTIQLVDLDGDGRADLCVRASDGLRCYKSQGHRFVPEAAWVVPGLADAAGWAADPSYYRTIHFGDVDGDKHPDVCARDASGVVCAHFNGKSFGPLVRWSSDFSDAAGWRDEATGGTVQLADVDGDHRADVCGRSPAGIVCALSNGHAFATAALFDSDFSDEHGWAEMPSRYRSIHFADIDGDKRADVCGRDSSGGACSLSSGHRFDRHRFVVNTDFRDSTGWSPERYGATVQLGDLNGDGRADLCGRSADGLTVAVAPER
jgi:peptidoglycan/xylan/chitin deacetylase (PgdA/CDA1 family)